MRGHWLFFVEDGEITPIIPLTDLDMLIDYTKNSNFGKVDSQMEALFHATINNIYANLDLYPNGEKLLGKFKKLLNRLFPSGQQLDAEDQRRIVEEHLKVVYLMQFMDAWTFDSSRLSKCSCHHLLPDDKTIPSCLYYSYQRRFDDRFARC